MLGDGGRDVKDNPLLHLYTRGAYHVALVSRNSRLVRACLLFAAILQLTLPGAAAWADARLDAGPAGTSHVEDHSTGACPRMHPADCALHRFLSAPLAVGTPAAVRLGATPQRTAVTPGRGLPAAALQGRLPDWRAPPQLS
jgi:hypothetical protein